MIRKYGEEQRLVIEQIKGELIDKLDKVYLEAFNSLTDAGLGNGQIARLTQLLLLSKDAAINSLKSN